MQRSPGLRVLSIVLLGIAVGVLIFFMSGGCASPQATLELDQARAELAQAQVEMEAVRTDPEATDAVWREAVLELASAHQRFVEASTAYVASAGASADGWISDGGLEGGAIGVGAAALTWLLRQRSRRKVERDVLDARNAAFDALAAAEKR